MEPEKLSGAAISDLETPLRRTSSTKQYRAKFAKRMSGRPSPKASSSGSVEGLASLSKFNSGSSTGSTVQYVPDDANSPKPKHPTSQIISQVRNWLHQEKERKASHRQKIKDEGQKASTTTTGAASSLLDTIHRHAPVHRRRHYRRSSSGLSEGALALEKLEQILEAVGMDDDRSSKVTRKRPSKLTLRKQSTIGASSDTENRELDELVPSADVILDNSKTLAYTGGDATSEADLKDARKRARRENEAWLQFKTEIVRLAHTLKLKGWRRVPIDRGGDLDVVRLSGALTNAVYVVTPPESLPPVTPNTRGSTTSIAFKRQPIKLLLRIYGPQAEHLIDRGAELQILKRLAQKNIGPRMLGTFTNGRFEEYFNARTLTAQDLRKPETSRQIAKRMRELHDGIELLKEERAAGPFVWQNWDKWVQRCEEVMYWVDQEIAKGEQKATRLPTESWRKRSFVCGVPWSIFRHTVDRYRNWLGDIYGDAAAINRDLVFAHNDTQYGNLLRLEPSGESPLLLPANEHKQLVVIDFEYASANMRGLEFANHFTEWCYNYHDKEKPYGLKPNRYPTMEEQRRFIEAYVQHRPAIPQILSPPMTGTPSALPTGNPISAFMLDSRAPTAQFTEDERLRDEAKEAEVKRLIRETRIWRVANSAFWVAWGIVQARIPGLEDAAKNNTQTGTPGSDDAANLRTVHITDPQLHPSSTADATILDTETPSELSEAPESQLSPEDILTSKEEPESEEEFDYLGYAQERAMFFWGDVLQLGVVKKEELPQELLEKIKIVEY